MKENELHVTVALGLKKNWGYYQISWIHTFIYRKHLAKSVVNGDNQGWQRCRRIFFFSKWAHQTSHRSHYTARARVFIHSLSPPHERCSSWWECRPCWWTWWRSPPGLRGRTRRRTRWREAPGHTGDCGNHICSCPYTREFGNQVWEIKVCQVVLLKCVKSI